MSDIVWVAGDFKAESENDSNAWNIIGITDTEEMAVSFCTQSNHFVAPIEKNKRLPDETTTWPDCYYPLAQAIEKPAPSDEHDQGEVGDGDSGGNGY